MGDRCTSSSMYSEYSIQLSRRTQQAGNCTLARLAIHSLGDATPSRACAGGTKNLNIKKSPDSRVSCRVTEYLAETRRRLYMRVRDE
jgi:hypothetical protein